jgi:hypothetical protein
MQCFRLTAPVSGIITDMIFEWCGSLRRRDAEALDE